MELDFNVLIWPFLCVLLIGALVVAKVVAEMRVNAPASPKKPGFNASSKRRDLSGNERSWKLPNIPGLDISDEVRSMVWLVGLGIIGVVIVGFVGFHLATMQWLDEDGHPVSAPTWIWPLLCVLIGLAAVAFKIVAEIRVESDTASRTSIPATKTSAKVAKPTGFNKPGKMKPKR